MIGEIKLASASSHTLRTDTPRGPPDIKAGIQIVPGQRFGLHNLRHSLSNWLVNKAKVEPKTVQGILRHSRIQTTLDLYTQDDGDETRAAQGQFLKAIGLESRTIQ